MKVEVALRANIGQQHSPGAQSGTTSSADGNCGPAARKRLGFRPSGAVASVDWIARCHCSSRPREGCYQMPSLGVSADLFRDLFSTGNANILLMFTSY
jgi:hypothetical protein